MRREQKIEIEINSIYDLKLKFNVTGREIRRKTQDSTQIDPIAFRIKGFLFRKFEDDRQYSRSDFSMFSQRNLTFKHSLDAKIDLEDEGSERFKD